MKNSLYNQLMVLLAVLSAISMTSPFVRVEVLHEQLIDGTCNTYFERFSALGLMLDGIDDFVIGGIEKSNLELLFYTIMALMIIATMQFIGGLFKNGKILLYTSIVLFAASFSFLYYAIKLNLDIEYGFYVYVILQVLIVFLAKTSKKDKQNPNTA